MIDLTRKISRLFNSLIRSGVDETQAADQNRYVILCNRISITFFGLAVFIVTVGLSFFGWILTIYIGYAASVLFIIPIILNRFGFTLGSRISLITIANLATLSASVADKFHVPGVLEQIQYFHLRIILLGASVFPFILFRLTEKKGWIFGLSLNFLCLLFFDAIHNAFGVGFFQLGLISPNYYFITYISVVVFAILAGSSYFLKSSFEKSEAENNTLIQDLHQANSYINYQRSLLASENQQLNRELVEKNNHLSEMNNELVSQNNELLQFSYSVSHNLRGPVASLIGLIRLAQREETSEELKLLFSHINRSVESLDMTIRDLSSIIELKNKVSHEKQLISLDAEIENIKVMLKNEIDEHRATIQTDFSQEKLVYSVKPMISSILYNLVSNAIKYRSPERLPLISISTRRHENWLQIRVHDNGLGLNIDEHKEKLFGMYKRFHTHTEGKGLGLFLVKLQAELLGGKINIESEPGRGTQFTVHIPALNERI